ncbi:MAG: tRNA uridine-5-carboxymethylaminomethyl(34) synthesis GTPase MnmE [Alphaproteobacteria bacterium]|nr:tRNA uridine-5-carboxymethylaminomethyl(34) synthesis GTPase MnmE [Alphaproteobacteria bacterium]
MDNRTIYALSTVFGKSGVAVVRISGADALRAVEMLSDIDVAKIKPRYAYYAKLHGLDGTPLDRALLLYFKAPHTFNGEDIVEFQVHGSKAVISSILFNLSQIEDFRLAEPGEFSKRAFYNSKMDLTEAEGLADLIDAETSQQQKYALRQMDGDLKDLYTGWRQTLVGVLSHLEAYIDFPDEELPEDIICGINNTVLKVKEEIALHIAQNKFGERLKDGFRVAIIGEPNAGKSSLLNVLANRKAAIVSDIPGTTRDAVDAYIDLNGYPVVFTDTAGLRKTEEKIEKIGVEIAKNKAFEADLIIALVDGTKPDFSSLDFIAKDKDKDKIIYVINKEDKLTQEQCSDYRKQGFLIISAKDKTGIEKLIKVITDNIAERFTANSSALITRQRYREILSDVLQNLNLFDLSSPIELCAEDIRLAARSIGKITGAVEVEEILDNIFGSFCIGK